MRRWDLTTLSRSTRRPGSKVADRSSHSAEMDEDKPIIHATHFMSDTDETGQYLLLTLRNSEGINFTISFYLPLEGDFKRVKIYIGF